ncbi:unnamed protein product [Sphagnum balticum]
MGMVIEGSGDESLGDEMVDSVFILHVRDEDDLGVDVVESRFDCAYIASELLVDAFVALGDYFVWVVDEAAADTGSPCAQAAAALSPAVHAFPVEGHLRVVFIGNW